MTRKTEEIKTQMTQNYNNNQIDNKHDNDDDNDRK